MIFSLFLQKLSNVGGFPTWQTTAMTETRSSDMDSSPSACRHPGYGLLPISATMRDCSEKTCRCSWIFCWRLFALLEESKGEYVWILGGSLRKSQVMAAVKTALDAVAKARVGRWYLHGKGELYGQSKDSIIYMYHIMPKRNTGEMIKNNLPVVIITGSSYVYTMYIYMYVYIYMYNQYIYICINIHVIVTWPIWFHMCKYVTHLCKNRWHVCVETTFHRLHDPA